MGASKIVKGHPRTDAGPRLAAVSVRFQMHLFILDRAPQAFDENVVHETPAPVHRNRDASGFTLAGERGAGELRALIRVEYPRLAVARQSLLQRFDAKPAVDGVRQPPSQNRPAGPIDDCYEIQKAVRHREWSKKRMSASPPRTVRAPFSAYGSPFKPGPWPLRHPDIVGDGLSGFVPEDVGICFRISPSELRLWAGYQSMQCFPDTTASFTDLVDKPGLGLPIGCHSIPIPHQRFDTASILPREPVRHFPEHDMINVLERGRSEVRVLVEGRPTPQLAVQAVHHVDLSKIMITREGFRQSVCECLGLLFGYGRDDRHPSP